VAPEACRRRKGVLAQSDIAEKIDQVEAPILMHHSLSEAHIALKFMRHLDDEGKPYDA
jgi:hypothetical protein